ncbi:MAG: porin [Bacteroidetes bacterium]|nr:porin [Bacteroidota bacterium]
MNVKNLLSAAVGILISASAYAQTDSAAKAAEKKPEEKKSHWFDKIEFGGYTQIRYSRLLETNKNLKMEQGDKSVGDGGSLMIRRARWKFSGQVHEKVYFYIQADLANSVTTSSGSVGGFFQLRDAYFDLGLDKKNQFWLRSGLQKIPFGFDNMQSSQNRLSLDRSDAFNSALWNERDLGTILYFTPEKIKKRYKSLVKEGLKGSGDYGVLALGLYTGQTMNRADLNPFFHYVAKASYPFEFKNKQIFEAGIQAYSGIYTLESVNTTKTSAREFIDQRAGITAVLYPKPFGIQAEYNIGNGPCFDPATGTITVQPLKGGYVLATYKLDVAKQTIIPFIRYQYYQGGKKHELDARKYMVHETEFGVEWQPYKNFELTVAYNMSDRIFEDSKKPVNQQVGNLLRIQLQVNY